VDQALAFDQAGPVAILVLVLMGLTWLTRYLLTKLIADKDAQIDELRTTVKAMTEDVGKTLDKILTTVQTEAEERRRRP
jgi:peptidoglycan hydrolase CwlO-like protein